MTRQRARLRLRIGAVLPLLAVGAMVPAVTVACGGDTTSQLETTLIAINKGPVNPGDTPGYSITVKNKGPSGASGVSIHVDLPASFKYKATNAIGGDGARTQPVDPPVNSPAPDWGIWSLGPPQTTGGKTSYSEIDLTFTVVAAGSPGNYQIVARSSGDTSNSDARPPTIPIQLTPAPAITMTVSVTPATARVNDTVEYTVTVANDGTGEAGGVGILLALPPGFIYADSDAGIKLVGNYARSSTINPYRQAAEPFFGTFTIPARSASGGSGLLTISFHAKVAKAVTGNLTVTAQLTDDFGDQVLAPNTAGVVVS